jgi:hypothetical protein
MWGNDPARVLDDRAPVQTVVNPAAQAVIQHLGYKGRLNGPVDNPSSSCLSCHSTAQITADLSRPTVSPVPPRNPSDDDLRRYFRNIKARTPFSTGHASLDYSLQLQNGIANRAEAPGLRTRPPGRRRDRVLDPSNGVRVKPIRR